jgi:DNA invertase Pin-like site-specific DNA recombinase
MITGYARVSTDDQKLDPQTDALEAAGAERIFADKITGTKRVRPQLDLMIDQLRQGDIVVVAKYDRLARSLKDLLDIVDGIAIRGAGFRSLAEDIDTRGLSSSGTENLGKDSVDSILAVFGRV